MLIKKGASLSTFKASALEAAAHIWDSELLKMLIAHGASPNDGYPLHRACFWRNRSAVEIFLDHGANPNKKKFGGKNAGADAFKHTT